MLGYASCWRVQWEHSGSIESAAGDDCDGIMLMVMVTVMLTVIAVGPMTPSTLKHAASGLLKKKN